MPEVFYDLTKPDHKMNYRWIQPPQIAYFVNTIDANGNVNCAGATLGTCVSVDMEWGVCGNFYFTLGLGYSDLPHVPGRQSNKNLHEVPEVVIAYIGNHLFREAQVACLPIPRGISEIEVMGLSELPSKHVRPPGLKEAKANIEGKVVETLRLGDYYDLFVCQAVGVSVDEELLEQDRNSELHAGIVELDPLFEVTVLGKEDHPPRLYVANLDMTTVRGLPDNFGPSRTFVGSFEDWMDDEVDRGALTEANRQRILELNSAWKENPDPHSNADVKKELTERLRQVIPKKN